MASTYGYTDPGGQAWMILDEARTRAYAEAIAAVVGPDDVVLDFGSGSGILALLAAKAGARRVIAVERTEAVELIRAHVEDNGLEDVVDVVRGDLLQLTVDDLREPATVIVSEMLGHFAPDEHMHRLYRAARRLATPDARLIPSTYRVCFALAALDDLDDELTHLENVFGVRLDHLADRLRSRPVVTAVPDDALLGPEAAGPELAVDAPLPESFAAEVEVTRSGRANALVASFTSQLGPGVELGTRAVDPPTHWRQTVFPLYPSLDVRAGERGRVDVRPRLVTDRGTWLWRVDVGDRTVGGDAMDSLLGADLSSIAEQLGLRVKRPADYRVTPRLRAWRDVLSGPVDGGAIDALVARLVEAEPERFGDAPEDARQEILALLRASGAL